MVFLGQDAGLIELLFGFQHAVVDHLQGPACAFTRPEVLHCELLFALPVIVIGGILLKWRQDGVRDQFLLELGFAGSRENSLRLPGLHNVRNALAAIAIAGELQVSDQAVVDALAKFEGIDRRFQIHGEIRTKMGKIMLVDDYGHHPTELAATLAAARAGWPGKRIVLAFQPHRYTRTRDLLDDFATVLIDADVLVLLEVFAAGEDPIAGADGRAIARAVRSRGGVEPVFIESTEELLPVLEGLLADGDLLLTMGAGDIGAVAARLPEQLRHGAPLKVLK
ncbi:MAG: hypothetical protein IH787_00065 [Nitrospirae bacterium]|nr:hypothetical protein [Nitrospirota bacterium]